MHSKHTHTKLVQGKRKKHGMALRTEEGFEVTQARTERLRKSAIPSMERRINLMMTKP